MSNIISPILDIVQPYLGSVKRSGLQNIVARCPFHDDDKPSFAINIENGLWICYACGLHGNLKTFLRNIGKDEAVIKATLAPLAEELDHFDKIHKIKESVRYRSDPFVGIYILPDAVLGMYNYMPIGLINVGFDRKILEEYEIGYDLKQDRIIFPIRDLHGNLVGVSGRATKKGDEPKYKVYKAGRFDRGKRIVGDFGEGFDSLHPNYDIRKSDHLWNAHRIYAEAMKSDHPLVVVEGFKACLWLIQSGYRNTIALMGSTASRNQTDLLRRMGGSRIVLFLDNDKAGIEGTRKLYEALSPSVKDIVIASYPEWASEPDEMMPTAITSAIQNGKRWKDHVRVS